MPHRGARRLGIIASAMSVTGVLACARPAAIDEPPRGPLADARPAFDARRLRTGRFTLHTTHHGADAGDSMISIARVDDTTYRFGNEVTGSFRQTWEATATRAMEPRSAALGIGPSDDKQRTMQLRYQAGAVTGTTTNPDPAKGPPTGEVHAEVPGDIVDQRIDWAALMSAPLAPGAAIAFTVYDPWTGISQVTAEVRAPERIAVAAGAFSVIHVTYRMAKPQRPVEQFELWVSEAPPRFLVREDFPNGATTQLVAAAP